MEQKAEIVKQGATVPSVPMEDSVVLAGDPEKQMEYATKSARVLVQVLQQKPKKVMINGEQYLEFEDWQTLGRFYGATVGVEWTKPVTRNNRIWGYEAKAVVFIKGEIVSSAEAMCTRDEKNWANRDEFALRSMAQTRASGKALRNVLAWVAVLGGFKPTPVEEMPGDMPRTYVPNEKIPNAQNKTVEEEEVITDVHYDDTPPPSPWDNPAQTSGGCEVEGCTEKVTDKVRDYSIKHFGGRVLCYKHQKA